MSNETKQTAVEWYAIEMAEYLRSIYGDGIINLDILKQAKEMEKQQKRKDFTDGYMHGNEPLNHDVIDKWYKETYGGNK